MPLSRLACVIAILAAPAAHGLEFAVAVEPQPANAGDNLTLVVSGHACTGTFSPVELNAGSAVTTTFLACPEPFPFTVRLPIGAVPAGEYVARVIAPSEAPGSQVLGEAEFLVGSQAGSPPNLCVPDLYTLCLRGGRFRVTATFDDPAFVDEWIQPRTRLLSFESGALYFFESGNEELFVKILDGCGVNQHQWLFVSGLTTLGVTINVHDENTGKDYIIHHAEGSVFPPRADINAFTCSAADSRAHSSRDDV